MVEAVGELEAASRDVGRAWAAQLEGHVGGDALPWLFQPPLAGEDLTGEDQPLGLGPALRQAPLDKELIEPQISVLAHGVVAGLCRQTLANQRRYRL